MVYHLKTRIAIAVSFLTMILMLLITWAAHSYFEKEFKAAAFKQITSSLDITAEGLSNRVHLALHSLEIISKSIPAENVHDPETLQGILDQLGPELITFDNGLVLFSPEGRLLAVNPRQQDVIGMDFSFRDYIKMTVLNRQPYISAPIKSRQSHQHPIIMFTEPIFNENDDIVAVLGGSFDLYSSNFLRALVTNKVGETGYYVMLDQKETMVIHPEEEKILSPASKIFPRYQIIDFLLNSQGVIPKFNIDGQDMIGAFQHVSPLNWTLVALTPLSEIYGPINQARFYTVAALCILFVLLVAIIRALTNLLILPLTELTTKVSRLAKSEGESFDFISEEYSELGDLSKSIQILVKDLADKRNGVNDQLLFLQNLIDTIPSPIFYKDAQFRYQGCNKPFEEFIGVSREDLVGKTAFDIAPPELAKVYHQADQDLWDKGDEQTYETSIKYADESIHDVIFYKKIYNDIAGQAAGMIGTFLDITDRKEQETQIKKALEEAQAAKSQVDNILKSAADGIVVTDRNNDITHINQIAEEIFEVGSKEVIGKPFSSLFDNSKLKEQARELLKEDGLPSHHKDFNLNLSDTEISRIIQARSSLLFSDDGSRSGIVILLQDVTRERELDQLKSEFISTAAHEMRTPMSVIMGYIEMLGNRERFGDINEEQEKKFLSEAYSKGELLAKIIDDLFDISRMEAGLPLPIDKSECDLNKIIESVSSHYAKSTETHVFKVSLQPSAEIMVDTNKMNQVFENLISNALKYSPEGGEIKISSKTEDNALHIEINDQGYGMTEEQLGRVFDKFYRADYSNAAITGLGLGMSIVKTIIEGHGGSIDIASTLGEGTTVSLRIPLHHD